MRTLKLVIAYDGTDYVGWQRQTNGPSIQQAIEDAMRPLCRDPETPPAVIGASRTDAGVHARGQVASVRVDFCVATDAVQRAINIRLPPDIRVLDVADMPDAFHARFDARSKRYRYRIVVAPVLSPFDRRVAWHVTQRCDTAAMRAAAALLVGRHDFAAFQATGTNVVDTIRTITRLDVVEPPGEIHLVVEGGGFLRHMVRIVAGSLVDVGVGTRPVAWMAEILARKDRREAGRTAPAAGLTLEEVIY